MLALPLMPLLPTNCTRKSRRTVHSLDTHSENIRLSLRSLIFLPWLMSFYRGITMQRAVERDSENRSNYAMCAVNPSRVSTTFSDAALREVVDSIATHMGHTASLLEIVNYNVEVSLTFLTAIHLDFLCIYRVNNMSVLENSSLCRL